MREWHCAHHCSWDCNGSGKGAELAAWETMLAHEADDGIIDGPDADVTVSVVMDLVKAFENVTLFMVWQWGIYWDMPPAILAVVCSYFSFARRVVVDGCFSEPLQTFTAIIAGSQWSVALLRMVIMWPMGQLLTLFPPLRLKVYVDDICATVSGKADAVRELMPNLVSAAVRLIEDVGLGVSRGQRWKPGGKSCVLSASRWLRSALTAPMKYHGMHVKAATVYMGVDTVVGRVRSRPKADARLSKLHLRCRRLLQFRKSGRRMARGVRMVLKQGIKPGYTYGHKCLGMSDSRVLALRRATAKTLFGKIGKGRSLTLQLAVANEEVLPDITAAPVMEWASAIWEHRVPDEMLRAAWKRQQATIGLKPSWSEVRGPAGA
eukprot:12430658-Karenia_brevis.AAC.1